MKHAYSKLFIIIAAAATLLYFGPFVNNFFAWDDFKYIENILYGSSAVIFGYDSLRVIANIIWLPLFLITGLDPLGYNLFSICLYFLNSLVLYQLILRLFKDEMFSFLAGILFVFSSVGADAVFWKSANSTLLNLFFYLLSLYAYVTYRQRNEKKYFTYSLLLFLFAMLSKEEAASLPLIILAAEALFFKGFENKAMLTKTVIPYFIIILAYIMATYAFNYLFHIQVGHTAGFRFKPLYSLFGGGMVFFISPEGYLNISDISIYFTAAFIVITFIFVKDRRLLIFGYLWVFFTFLPQSLSGAVVFDFRGGFNFGSVSRYLYLPSVGSSIIFAAVISNFRDRLPQRIYIPTLCLLLFLFVSINYNRVHVRGEGWRFFSQSMERFLYSLKDVQPTFPENSYVHVVNKPTKQAFIQQSLRAFYKNSKIYWTDNLDGSNLKKNDSLFVIFHNWTSERAVNVWRKR